MHVHNEQRYQLTQRRNGADESRHEVFGRHGDIKADNILWFGGNDELVLDDFRLARLNSQYSRSGQDPKMLEKSNTYKAPEFDLHKGTISRVSDIFSFGCMCLEFMTWYLEGWEAVSDEFPEYRLELDISGQEPDTFFRLEGYNTEEERAIIKLKVKKWILKLKKTSIHSAYILQFLELIEERMLEPDSKKRIKADELVKKIDLLVEACRKDSSVDGGHFNPLQSG